MKLRGVSALLTAFLLAILCLALDRVAAQTPAARVATTVAKTADGKPDLNGIWQVFNAAALGPRGASAGRKACPADRGWSRAAPFRTQPGGAGQETERTAPERATADPLSKCYLPGVPRITYMPLPFEITQTPKYVVIAYEFAHARRIIYTDGSPHVEALEFWMGDSRGKWEGDTLVVDTNNFTTRRGSTRPATTTATRCTSSSATRRWAPNHINYEVDDRRPKGVHPAVEDAAW